jgi:hypothetical protein
MATPFYSFLLKECSSIQSMLDSRKITKNDGDIDSNSTDTADAMNSRTDIDTFMLTMDFNVPLLEDVITNYRFDFSSPTSIHDLIEIVRMLDILGAEVRYKEYGLNLFDKLNNQATMEDWLPYADRIPVSFEELANKSFYKNHDFQSNRKLTRFLEDSCILGSKPLLFYLLKQPEVDKKEMFVTLCNYGHFELAYELDNVYEIQQYLRAKDQITIFKAACKYGQLDIAQKMNVFVLNEVHIHRLNNLALIEACSYGHLEVCEWLYGLGGIDIHGDYESAFVYACANGHLSVAKWLVSLENIDQFQFNQKLRLYIHTFCRSFSHQLIETWLYDSQIIDRFCLNEVFRTLCELGNLLAAQRLFDRFPDSIDIHCWDDSAFSRACYSGNMELVQWLYGLGGINIHSAFDEPFINACGQNLEMAQWLYNFGEINIHTKKDKPFNNACIFGHLDIAQWLYYNVGDGQINYSNTGFRYAIECGHLDMVKWLYSLGGFDEAISSETYKIALRKGHLSLARWLYAIANENHSCSVEVANLEKGRRGKNCILN